MKPTVTMDRTLLRDVLAAVEKKVCTVEEAFNIIDAQFTRIERKHDELRKRDHDQGWALENFRQEQRDNFHGDGQW